MDTEKDKKLIQLFCERSEIAIKSTTTEYKKYLSSISYRILQNTEDVEECVNDTFMKAWNSIPPTIPDSLRAYLGSLVRNISLDCYRKQHYIKRNKDFQVMLDECSDMISTEGNPEESLDISIISESISEFLVNVDQEKRYLFTRRYYFGDTIKELAHKRGLTESNVKITLYRMRKKLQKKLEFEGVSV